MQLEINKRIQFAEWFSHINRVLDNVYQNGFDTSGHLAFILETIHDSLSEYTTNPQKSYIKLLYIIWENRSCLDYSIYMTNPAIDKVFDPTDFKNPHYDIICDLHKLANIVLTGLPVLGVETNF